MEMICDPASSSDCDELCACAESAARKAGRHALEHSGRRREVVRASARDVKLTLDYECQAVAENVIRARFPRHRILGEESAEKDAVDSGLVWIIDPIDGTVNFFHGLPVWCSSVAVLKDGKPIAGAVYSPVTDECYTARADGPSCCNGRPVSVSQAQRVEDAIVATGIDRTTGDISRSMELMKRLVSNVRRPRIMGSAALDLCRVACGQIDGYYESGIYLWDVAAGSLIVERAGGRAETLWRGEDLRTSFLATNGRLHDDLRRILVA